MNKTSYLQAYTMYKQAAEMQKEASVRSIGAIGRRISQAPKSFFRGLKGVQAIDPSGTMKNLHNINRNVARRELGVLDDLVNNSRVPVSKNVINARRADLMDFYNRNADRIGDLKTNYLSQLAGNKIYGGYGNTVDWINKHPRTTSIIGATAANQGLNLLYPSASGADSDD